MSKDWTWSVLDQGVVSGCNFLLGLLLARLLGLNDFGVFTLCWSLLLLTAGIQNALVIYPMLTLGPKFSGRAAREYYIATFYHQVAFAIGSVSIIILGEKFVSYFINVNRYSDLVVPLCWAIFAFQLQEFLRKLQYAHGTPSRAFCGDVLSYGGKLVVIFYLGFSEQLNIRSSLWVMGVTSFLGFFAFSGDIKFSLLKNKKVKTFFLRNWRFSIWLLPASLAQWVSGHVFFFYSGGLLSTSVVGAIKSAQNLMGITHIFFQALEGYLPPRASRLLVRSGRCHARALVKKVGLYGLVGVLGFSLLVAFYHDEMFVYFYGDEFLKYADTLFWCAITYPFIYMSIVIRIWLRTLEQTKLILKSYLIMAGVACVVGYPLIFFYGAEGAMIGILITHVVMFSTLRYLENNVDIEANLEGRIT